MSLELHRQCVFPALAVVGGVDGVNVPPPARKLGGVIPADTVELHGMDAAQRTALKLYDQLGEEIYCEALRHIVEAWEGKPDSFRAAVLRGVM